MEKLESLQKRALRWILFEENRSYSPQIYLQKCKDIDILPFSKKFDLNYLIFFHKIFNELVPVNLPAIFLFMKVVHDSGDVTLTAYQLFALHFLDLLNRQSAPTII
jgi:hypothetical protein